MCGGGVGMFDSALACFEEGCSCLGPFEGREFHLLSGLRENPGRVGRVGLLSLERGGFFGACYC